MKCALKMCMSHSSSHNRMSCFECDDKMCALQAQPWNANVKAWCCQTDFPCMGLFKCEKVAPTLMRFCYSVLLLLGKSVFVVCQLVILFCSWVMNYEINFHKPARARHIQLFALSLSFSLTLSWLVLRMPISSRKTHTCLHVLAHIRHQINHKTYI